jgi:ethanolamine utilization protein EutM
MKALGLIETIGLATAFEAADAALKAANVKLLGYENTKGGGRITVKFVGDVGAVKAAVAAGIAAALRIGRVESSLVIARPHQAIEGLIGLIDRGPAAAGEPVVVPQPASEAPQPASEAPAPASEAPQPAPDAPQPASEAPAPASEAPQPAPAKAAKPKAAAGKAKRPASRRPKAAAAPAPEASLPASDAAATPAPEASLPASDAASTPGPDATPPPASADQPGPAQSDLDQPAAP